MHWLVRSEAELPGGVAWLAPSEHERVDRIRFTKRRTEFLLRRLVAKQAVAALTGMPAGPAALRRIDIRNEPGGAPYAVIDGRPSNVDVSLSDRSGWAVCLAGHGMFGCDLEIVEPRSAAFVAEYLTPSEQSFVRRAADPDVAANVVWSAKESALKALRTGLRRDPRDVEVTTEDGASRCWRRLSVRTVEGLILPGWWRRDGRFLFTMAAAHAGPPPAALEDPFSVLAAAAPAQSWLARPLLT